MLDLRKFESSDMEIIWQIGFSDPAPEWANWDAPYYEGYQHFSDFVSFTQSSTYDFLLSDQCLGIFVDNQPIGMVSRYWESKETRWMELGIIIYNQNYWSGGYGSQALSLWLTRSFNAFPEIEHLGLTTWSGNIRMMKAAEKVGLVKEGQIRKVRYWQGIYYDSLKYGILREEWQAIGGESG